MSDIIKSARSAVLESSRPAERHAPPAADGAPVSNSSSLTGAPRWLLADQPARVCFLAGFVALSSAGAGWLVNHFLTGWMEVAGMAAVGLFYLGLGLLEWGRKPFP